MNPSSIKELHGLTMHVFESEQARDEAQAAGIIGPDDLVLTPDTGSNVYDQLAEAAHTADAAADRANGIAAILEDAVATNAFQGAPGPPGAAVQGYMTVSLAADMWQGNTQAVDVPGVTPDSHVMVCPSIPDFGAYVAANLHATALLESGVVFACAAPPAIDIDANVLILS